jgi:hypothetical protein
VKYAHTATLVLPGLRTQAVVTLLVVFPVFPAVLAAMLKVTALPLLTVTVSDSGKVAVKVRVAVFEFCAPAAAANKVNNINAGRTIDNFRQKRINPP